MLEFTFSANAKIQFSWKNASIFLFATDAGGCPAATFFLCFAKERRQRKATRGSSPRQKRRGALRYSNRQAAAELGLE